MTWIEYKLKLTIKTPQLKDKNNKLTLSVDEFLRHLEKAFHVGKDSYNDNIYNNYKQHNDNDSLGIFKDIFNQ